MRWTLAILILSLLSAGCLTLPQDPAADAPAATQSGPATMTASESRQNTTGLCSPDVYNNGAGNFCATRTITVTGTISGLAMLDVGLESFNGPVTIDNGEEGKWGFVAVLVGRGESEAEAKSRLESISFSWAHQRAGNHVLDVVAKKDRDTEGRSADLQVKLPRSVVLSLTAGTINGQVTAKGVRTSELALGTTNGDVVADVEVMNVQLGTTNGDVDAKLRPFGAGRIDVGTTNGEVKLRLPEGDAFGYKVDAATTNGEVEITLRDGKVGPCPEGGQYYTPPCNSRSFETSGFSSRTFQSYVEAGSTNGGIRIDPV